MKRLERNCKVCGHPRRNHRADGSHDRVMRAAKCNNCAVLEMYHEFVLDNLKYLEEAHEQLTHKRSE